MDLFDDLQAGLGALDLAIQHAVFIHMDWEGGAAESARVQLSECVEEMVRLRHQLAEARDQAIATKALYYARMSAAVAGW